MPNEQMHNNELQPNQGDIPGLRFIHILFALALAPAFTEIPRTSAHDYDKLAQLVVAVTVIAFSWVGYNRTRGFEPRQLRFKRPCPEMLQHLLDIFIIGLYFGLASHAANNESPSVVVQTALLAVVFFCYLVWDWLGHYSKDATVRRMARNRLPGSAGGTLVLCIAWLFLLWGRRIVDGPRWVVFIDLLYIGGLYLYRVVQEIAEENASPNEHRLDAST